MPLFVITGFDVPNSHEARAQLRPAHLERLHALQRDHRLIIAGPTPITHGGDDMSGSVIIAEFTDQAEAERWAKDEPYLKGVYSHVDIKPFIRALG